jgi:hypothetical protein
LWGAGGQGETEDRDKERGGGRDGPCGRNGTVGTSRGTFDREASSNGILQGR